MIDFFIYFGGNMDIYEIKKNFIENGEYAIVPKDLFRWMLENNFTASEIVLFFILFEYGLKYNKYSDDDYFYISFSKMAKLLNTSKPTAMKCCETLVDKKLLFRELRIIKGHGNYFYMINPKILDFHSGFKIKPR